MRRAPKTIRAVRDKIVRYVTNHEGVTAREICCGIRMSYKAVERDIWYLTSRGVLFRDEADRYYPKKPSACLLADLYAPKIDPTKDKVPSRKVKFGDDWKPNKDRPRHRVAISSGMGFDAVRYGAMGYGD